MLAKVVETSNVSRHHRKVHSICPERTAKTRFFPWNLILKQHLKSNQIDILVYKSISYDN